MGTLLNAPLAKAPEAQVRSPWDDARAQHPAGTKLMRVINLKAMTQHFDVVQPQPGGGDDYLDGCTLIMPQLARTDAERRLILDVYDRLWFSSTSK